MQVVILFTFNKTSDCYDIQYSSNCAQIKEALTIKYKHHNKTANNHDLTSSGDSLLKKFSNKSTIQLGFI